MKKPTGSLLLLTIRGTPIYVHWSFPADCFIVSILVGANLLQAVYFCLSYFFLIAIHEAGHFLAARIVGLKVVAVEMSSFGGHCQVESPRRALHSVWVYSAGLLAQLALLLLVWLCVALFGSPTSLAMRSLYQCFTYVNLLVMALNLLPWRPKKGKETDGLVLWQLFLHVFAKGPHPHPRRVFLSPDASPVFPPETRLLSLPAFQQPDFTTGIEILNDRTTPAALVVTLLTRYLLMEREKAIETMLEIHNNGGILIPYAPLETAQQLAQAMCSEARDTGHNFVCRPVDSGKIGLNQL